jgi:hypothetical protein
MAAKTSYPYVGAMRPGASAKTSYPYVGAMTEEGTVGPATIAKFNGVLASAIEKYNGVEWASILKVNGVA